MARISCALAVTLIFMYGCSVEVEGLYKIFRRRTDWDSALKECTRWGGVLANIQSATENSFIAKAMRDRRIGNSWIGHNDRKSEGKWSADPIYFNFGEGEPNNFRNNEDCAAIMISSGKWNDNPCNRRKSYVCKTGKNYVYLKGPKTWADAEKDCVQRGGHLACISTGNENQLVTATSKKRLEQYGRDTWIGMNDIDSEGNWKCVGSTYSNFVTGEPNGAKREDCGQIYPNGGWNDSPCSDRHTFVCQKGTDQRIEEDNQPPAGRPPGLCPGWPLPCRF